MLYRHAGTLVLVTVLACCVGCGGQQPAEVKKAEPPAKVGNPVKETELGTITLSPEAEGRLGIQTAVVERKKVARARTYGGEAVLPPGQSITLTSPVAGKISTPPSAAPLTGGATVRQGQALLRLAPLLAPERDMLPVAEKDVASGEARLEAARARVKRAEQLLRDEAGSARSLEDARMELALAEAEVKSARTRLERIKTTPLETEARSRLMRPAMASSARSMQRRGKPWPRQPRSWKIATLNPIWIRVPVYVGDLDSIDPQSPAVVQSLAGGPARLPGTRDESRLHLPQIQAPTQPIFSLSCPTATARCGRASGSAPGWRCSAMWKAWSCLGPRLFMMFMAGPGFMRTAVRTSSSGVGSNWVGSTAPPRFLRGDRTPAGRW